MKRLFIAVPIAEEVKIKLRLLLQDLQDSKADLKMVSVENLHFTLKFLGDVDEEKISEIIDKLTVINQKSFSLSLSGAGVFPSSERIGVLWVGINSPELILLMKKINLALNYIHQEKNEEIPHLTITRVKSGRNKERLRELVQKYKNTSFGEMVVEKIILYESELGKERPKYSKIREFALQG